MGDGNDRLDSVLIMFVGCLGWTVFSCGGWRVGHIEVSERVSDIGRGKKRLFV